MGDATDAEARIAATKWRCGLIALLATAFVMSLVPPTSPARRQTAPAIANRAPEARSTGAKVIFPIVMVREFPFINGEIAGVRGKLMLDTGTQEALVINDHRVPLTGGTTVGKGFFGSG